MKKTCFLITTILITFTIYCYAAQISKKQNPGISFEKAYPPKQNTSGLTSNQQNVKMIDRQIMEDFDQDGQYKPFFVKGVGYAPVPVGHFFAQDWWGSADCYYAGPYPLNYPEQRFKHGANSPDGKYECKENGTNFYQSNDVFNRDFSLIKEMNANTIRTWGKITPLLTQKAQEYNLKIMAGYWINYNVDFTFPGSDGKTKRQAIIDDFINYVNTYKDNNAILMWGLSNENNIHFCDKAFFDSSCNETAQAEGYFKLMNDMTLLAKQAEGNSYHPVIIVLAEDQKDYLYNNASLIPNIEILGINSYRGKSFNGWPEGQPSLFDKFTTYFPNKSLIITEFGIDAWDSKCDRAHPESCDPTKGVEDQTTQSNDITSAWEDIFNHSVVNGGPGNGGVVFHYTDQWNMYAEADENNWVSSDWTPSVITHDVNVPVGNPMGGSNPDGFENPEWWGITSIKQNPDGSVCNTPAGVDCITPREAYYSLKEKFLLDPIREPKIENVTQSPQKIMKPLIIKVKPINVDLIKEVKISVTLTPKTVTEFMPMKISGENYQRTLVPRVRATTITYNILVIDNEGKNYNFGPFSLEVVK